MLAVRVIGRGRAGRGLASAWRSAGVAVSTARGRGSKYPRVDRDVITVVAVPDPELARVDALLAKTIAPGSVVLHCAGSRGPEALPACAERAFAGAMHPLASFADPSRPPALAGATFVVAGPRACVSAATRLARAIDARVVRRAVHGPRYHAAAALAANGSTALAAVAVRVMRELGMSRREAERAIGGLLMTVAENVASVGVPRALTGPIVRGDAAAVRAHRAALDPKTRAIYDAIAPAILACARDAGLDPKRSAAIERAIRTSR